MHCAARCSLAGRLGPTPGPGCVSPRRQSPQHLTLLPCPATGTFGDTHPVPILQKGVWPRISTRLSSGHHRKLALSHEPRVCARRVAPSFRFPKSHAWVQTPLSIALLPSAHSLPWPAKVGSRSSRRRLDKATSVFRSLFRQEKLPRTSFPAAFH